MADIWMFHTTFARRDEAVSMARELLAARLIACANIQDDVTSLYRWEGEIKQDTEVLLLAKTSKARLHEAMAWVKASHPYELPCIAAYPIQEGHAPYLQWVAAETQK